MKHTHKSMRTFYIIWFGQLISTIGSGISGFALGVWIYEEAGSVTAFGLNFFAYLIAGVILSPVAGAVVDRFNRRLILIFADSIAGISTIVVLLLYQADALALWQIYMVTFIVAGVNTFQWIANQAATTMLVPKEQLGRAGGLVQIGSAISDLVAPAAAGFLFLAVGLNNILLIDLATFAFAVISLLVIQIPEPEKVTIDTDEKRSFREDFVFGWRYIYTRKGFWYWMLYIATLNFGLGMFVPIITPLLLESGTPDQAGMALSFIGGVMFIGTLVMSVWGGFERKVVTVILSGTLMGVAILLAGIRPSISFVILGCSLFHFLMPILNGSAIAFWQLKVPADVQGRVFAVRRMIGMSLGPVAALIVGPFIDNVTQPMMAVDGVLADSVGRLIGTGPGRGAGLAILLIGMGVIVSSLIAWNNKTLRNAEIDIPDAETPVVAAGSHAS